MKNRGERDGGSVLGGSSCRGPGRKDGRRPRAANFGPGGAEAPAAAAVAPGAAAAGAGRAGRGARGGGAEGGGRGARGRGTRAGEFAASNPLFCERYAHSRMPGPAQAEADWAGLPRDLLEKVGRAVPAGDRLWFRLVCRCWAAVGAEIAQAAGERELIRGGR